jgi:cytochrome P450
VDTLFTPDQLSTPEVIANPYPAYRQLREGSPVNYVFIPAGALPSLEEPIRAWAFLKYADVYARAEAKITLNAFLDRFTAIKRGPTPAVRQTFTPLGLGFQQLPLVLERKR